MARIDAQTAIQRWAKFQETQNCPCCDNKKFTARLNTPYNGKPYWKCHCAECKSEWFKPFEDTVNITE
jgi:hypothetical protein